MINKKVEQAINEQINAEMFSAYLYLSMSAWFETQSLAGFASWMKVQFQEEMFHADKFYNYIHERGGQVTLKAIEGPQTEWKTTLDVFEATLAHEQKVTGLINDLVSLAEQEKDHATRIFLEWFVSEQVEEEKSADDVIQQLKLMANAPGGIFMLNRELAQRTFTPPAAEAE
jgi:ferritin